MVQKITLFDSVGTSREFVRSEWCCINLQRALPVLPRAEYRVRGLERCPEHVEAKP